MNAENAKLAKAEDFIRTEFPKFLGGNVVFNEINADTFLDDNSEEINVIFVSFKTDIRPLDPRVLVKFHSESWNRFLEMGFETPPAISYDDQPLTIA